MSLCYPILMQKLLFFKPSLILKNVIISLKIKMEFIFDLLYGLLFAVIIFLVLAGFFKCLMYCVVHSGLFTSRPRPVFISYLQEPNSVSSIPISSVQQEFGSSAGVSRNPSSSEMTVLPALGAQSDCRQCITTHENLGCLKMV